MHSDSSEWGHGALPDGASHMEVPGEGACASSGSILCKRLSIWRLAYAIWALLSQVPCI